MRLLLTGGAGYVGSSCLRWLLARGHEVLAYDDLSEGNRGSVPGSDRRLVVGSLVDRKHLADVMTEQRTDAVLHFAALASVPESLREPARYWSVNVGGTQNVLDAMRLAGVTRIVFSSTAATYGFHVPMPLREDSMQLPETPYGSTKLACERLIRDYARAYDMGYVFLRYFNASGADPSGEYGEARRHESHLIPLILQTAMGRRSEVLVFGDDWPTPDGTCVRDYVHTDDLAQAHERAVETLEPGMGRAYNLGNGTGVSVREVLAACEAAVARPIPHRTVSRRAGDPPVLVASPEAIQRELGWTPRFTGIAEIVSSAWRWHSSHPDGYPEHRPTMRVP